MIDASTFSLLDRNGTFGEDLSAGLPSYGGSGGGGYYMPPQGQYQPPGQPQEDKSIGALEWIGALTQLGAIIGQVLAAKKRKKKNGLDGAIIIPGEGQRTAIHVPEEDVSGYLPGVTR